MFKTPPYRIETHRLVIRCWEPRDAALMKAAVDRSLDHLRPWLPWTEHEPETIDQKIDRCRTIRARFDSDSDYMFGIFNADETRVLGSTGLHTRQGPHAFEIGYWVAEDHLKQGIATEASTVMTCLGLGYCGRDRMEIRCDPENTASVAVPRKLGYSHEVTRIRLIPTSVKGEMRDCMVWTLFSHQYPEWPHRKFAMKAYDAAGRQVI